jgi:hypothetical protein
MLLGSHRRVIMKDVINNEQTGGDTPAMTTMPAAATRKGPWKTHSWYGSCACSVNGVGFIGPAVLPVHACGARLRSYSSMAIGACTVVARGRREGDDGTTSGVNHLLLRLLFSTSVLRTCRSQAHRQELPPPVGELPPPGPPPHHRRRGAPHP